MIDILLAMLGSFAYIKLKQCKKIKHIQFVLFIPLLFSHLIWNYSFLATDLLLATSGVDVISFYVSKLKSK